LALRTPFGGGGMRKLPHAATVLNAGS